MRHTLAQHPLAWVAQREEEMPHKTTVAILSLLVIVCFAACAPQATPTPTALPTPERTATPTRPAATVTATSAQHTATLPAATPTASWTTYSDPSYHITLKYPSAWHFIPGYGIKYGGADGFFQLSAISGPSASIDEIAENDAYHKLLPYGSQPTIEPLEIDGQPARLILPSADQPQAMAGQSGLIVQLPEPIAISGDRYNFIILWADEQHIRQIAGTLSLMLPISAPTPTLAPASVPEAVQRVFLALSRQFQAKADQLQLLGYEYVGWPDGCLGIPMRAVCTQAIVPGFRILVRYEGQDYEYRSDQQGSRFLLASAPAHGIDSPALIWEGGEVCDTLLLGKDGRAAVGPCDAPLRPTELLEGSYRLEQWSVFLARFSAIEAETPSGSFVFHGSGKEAATPPWQRAMAAWAQLVYQELHSGRSNPEWSSALTWQEEIGDSPGYCRSLRVESFGYAVAQRTLCAGGFTQIAGEDWLTKDELEVFDAWYYGHAALELADVSFGGRGPDPMSEAEIEQLKRWASSLHSRLAES